jgi:hypothetical protein
LIGKGRPGYGSASLPGDVESRACDLAQLAHIAAVRGAMMRDRALGCAMMRDHARLCAIPRTATCPFWAGKATQAPDLAPNAHHQKWGK